jgi:putative transposase
MKTTYKFRIYPNRVQEAQLNLTLEICRHLWNTALADRKNTWVQYGLNTSYEDQAAILTNEKKLYPELRSVYSQVLQDVLRRLKKAFDNFRIYTCIQAQGDRGQDQNLYPEEGQDRGLVRVIHHRAGCS